MNEYTEWFCTKVSKHLIKYRSENNFILNINVERSNWLSKLYNIVYYV